MRRTAAPSRADHRWVLGLAGLALIAAGCATPVGVKPVDIQTAYRLHTESALSAGQPSEPSKTVLRRLGLLDRFDEAPGAVLAELHSGLRPAGDDDRLFALAELSFLHAERTGDRAYFLASAVYAWALLFPGDATSVQLQRSDPRLRLAYDLYNQAVAQGLTEPRTRMVRAVALPPQRAREAARCGWSRERARCRSGRSRSPWTSPGCRGVATGSTSSSRRRPSRSGASGTATAGPGSARPWRRAWRRARRQRTSSGRSASGPGRRWR